MILLNGVSGFNIPDPAIQINGHYFKKICYAIVLKLGGNIISFNEPEIARSYYEVRINIRDEDLFILLNHVYPFITFASSMEGNGITFVSHDKLEQEFAQYYRVLRLNEVDEALVLNEKKGRLIVENHNELNDAELNNIKYWQARRVGEVVFNGWD